MVEQLKDCEECLGVGEIEWVDGEQKMRGNCGYCEGSGKAYYDQEEENEE